MFLVSGLDEARLSLAHSALHGYLVHKKQRPPGTLSNSGPLGYSGYVVQTRHLWSVNFGKTSTLGRARVPIQLTTSADSGMSRFVRILRTARQPPIPKIQHFSTYSKNSRILLAYF